MEIHIKVLEDFHIRVQSIKYRNLIAASMFAREIKGKKDEEKDNGSGIKSIRPGKI